MQLLPLHLQQRRCPAGAWTALEPPYSRLLLMLLPHCWVQQGWPGPQQEAAGPVE